MRGIEGQIRLALRAWPISDRGARGDEIVGTTLDVVPTDRALLPVVIALDLVVAGVRARWRLRPPLPRWAWYRLGGRLPDRWHQWVVNDLDGPGWRRRMAMSSAMPMAASVLFWPLVLSPASRHHGWGDLVVLFLAALGGALVAGVGFARRRRDRALARHGIALVSPGDPPWPPPWPDHPDASSW